MAGTEVELELKDAAAQHIWIRRTLNLGRLSVRTSELATSGRRACKMDRTREMRGKYWCWTSNTWRPA